MRFKNK